MRTIYQEVVESYNVGLNFSCASGLRVLLEGICVDMGIEDKEPTRSLTDKLYALAERGLVKPEIVDNLFALKFIGDEVIHHSQDLAKKHSGVVEEQKRKKARRAKSAP